MAWSLMDTLGQEEGRMEGPAGIKELPCKHNTKGPWSLKRGKHYNGWEFDGSSSLGQEGRMEGPTGIREFRPRRLVSGVH